MTATIERAPTWEVGDRLRKALRKAGLTGGEMAEYLGVSGTAVSSWMTGRSKPRIGFLRLWAMHCGVDLDWIRTGFGAESIELQWDLGDHLRKALQMADVGVAEMADYIGSHRSTVSAWIGGQAEPKVGVLRLWAMRTGVDFAWLCAARDSNPEPADLWPVAA